MIRYPKPALLDQLPPRRGVVQASAGTGKTYTLERMVVAFVLQGVKLEELLVVTFTEKATLELKARVRAMLETMAALDEAGPEAEAVAEVEGPAWDLGPAERKALGQALRDFDRSTISTIHGFCRRILQESAFEGGSLLQQELADGRVLLGRAWRDLVRGEASAGPLGAFLKEVLAGGRTVARLEQMLWDAHTERGRLRPEAGADPAALFAAFDPAWAQAKDLIGAAIAALDSKALHGRTKEAALTRLDGFFPWMAQCGSAFALAEGWDFESLLKACGQLEDGPGRALGDWLAAFKAAAGTPQAMIVRAFLEPVRERVRALKAQEGVFDHDDMVLGVRKALRGDRGPALLERLRQRYKVALIDEFQDTDQVQWEIFHTIFDHPGCRLYVIGDPKQAIYGFRGGDLATYEQAKAILLDGAEPLELQENHRSTQGVIDAYNHIFTGGERDKQGLATTAFFTDPGLYPLARQVRCGNPRLTLAAGDGEGLAPVKVIRLETLAGGTWLWRKVAQRLAWEIHHLIEVRGASFGDPGSLDPAKAPRPLDYGDVQVLVGKRREGLLVAQALREQGIPFAFFKQDGLFRGEEAKDLLDLLRAVLDPRDRSRLARALVTPFFGYRLEELDALPALPEDHPAVLRLLDLQRLGRTRQFARLFETILGASGLVQRLRLGTTSERALTNHLHLAELLSRAAQEGAPDLEDLVRLLKRWMSGAETPPGEDGSVQRLEGEKRAVQIMTMHQSKGLEAAVVGLFGFTGTPNRSGVRRYHEGSERCLYLGDPPDEVERLAKAEAGAEAERLLYVALTRAKAHLILPCFVVDRRDAKGKVTLKHPQGHYQVLNRRLRQILDQDPAPDLFEVGPLTADELARKAVPAPLPDLSGFAPPPLAPPAELDYEAGRRRARPAFTTSFTQLHQRLEGRAAAEEGLPVDGERDRPGVALPAGDLPKGPRTGQLIHELLETVELGSAEAVPFADWWEAPDRQAWVLAALARHDVPESYAERAGRMVYEGLRAPLQGQPVARHEHALRELDFLARYLDTADLLQGALDLVFERDGRIHLLDWKTNTLPDYGPEALAAAMAEDYLLQVKVYLHVVAAFFGLEDEAAYEARFGAIHYVYLRGLPGAGVWTDRPSWATLQAWRQDLQDLHGMMADV